MQEAGSTPFRNYRERLRPLERLLLPDQPRGSGAPPPISVLTVAYDAEATLGATLASVRDQTLGDHEHLVVDAGSCDGTLEVVRQAALQDSRIRIFRAVRRLSPPLARNAGLAEILSEVVAVLDADDLSLPHRLSCQLEALSRDPSLVAVGGLKTSIDRAGLPLEGRPEGREIPMTPAAVRFVLPLICPTIASTTAYRCDALRRVGGFDAGSPWADDYAILPELAALGGISMLPTVVTRYRRHATQLSSAQRTRQHLEVVLLRQRISTSRLGRRPLLSSVLAWSEPRVSLPRSAYETALRDLHELVQVELSREDLDTADRSWILKEGDRRCNRLSEQRDSVASLAG